MQTPLLLAQSSLECPKCGKHAVVSVEDGLYQCLHCDFRRNLHPQTPDPDGSSGGAVMFGAFGFVITLLLLL